MKQARIDKDASHVGVCKRIALDGIPQRDAVGVGIAFVTSAVRPLSVWFRFSSVTSPAF
jgi:hypothetical protein